MKKYSIVALALAIAAPVIATPGTPTSTGRFRAPVDQAHLTAGTALVDQVYPLGYTKQMMNELPGAYMDLFLGMTPKDLLPEDLLKEAPKKDRASLDKTFRQLLAKEDPNFEERIRITLDVVMKEFGPAIDKMEPTIRKGMSLGYGRNLSVEHMNELATFFKTPAGQAFNKSRYLAALQPEVMLSYKEAIPELMKLGPDLPKKIEKATAHLPKSKLMDAMTKGAKGKGMTEDNPDPAPATDDQPWMDPKNWSTEDRAAYEKADAEAAEAMAKSETLMTAASERAKARMKKK